MYHRRLDRWAGWAFVLGALCLLIGLTFGGVRPPVFFDCLERLGCALLGMFNGLMLARFLSVVVRMLS
jgi:hypothetical protein